jgi:hypothetical protein
MMAELKRPYEYDVTYGGPNFSSAIQHQLF